MTSVRPLFGAAIIVKDEADHLRRCLASIRELCDEIVVVDTGSSDESVAVARSFGATVLHRPWDGDFSSARNLGLDNIRAEWILYIDADEEVQGVDVAAVRATLRTADGVVGFLVKFAAHVGWTPYWEHRVWRHRDDVRFFGRIHETIVPDLRRIVRDEGQRFERIDLFFQHYGYEGDQTAKHRRNLPMLQEQVKGSPLRVYLWNHIGRIHEALGDADEAEAAFRHGLSIVREHGMREPVDILVYGSLAMFMLRQGRDASEIIAEGLAHQPDFYSLHLADAHQRLRASDWEGAEAALRTLIAAGQEQIVQSVVAYNGDLFNRLPWEMLGECLFEQARYREAAEAYETAAFHGSDELEMRTKTALCRALSSHQQ